MNGQRGIFFQIIYYEEIIILSIVKKIGNTTVLPHGYIVRCKKTSYK
jgi:hypothetical protein